VSVLVADDHARSREEIAQLLTAHGFDVVAQAASAEGAVAAAREGRPDLCVLDVSMPGGGIAAIAPIKRALPQGRIVMLTAYSDPGECIESLRLGADGYLAKDMDWGRLPLVLRDVLSGHPAIPRAYGGELLADLRAARGRRRLRLG
jgi:two-component system NarL family response regulator